MTLIPCSSTGAETLHGMPRKQPLGRKHKAGTGNNMEASASRIISKTKVVTFSTQVATSSQVRVAYAWLVVPPWFECIFKRAAACCSGGQQPSQS